MRYVIRDVYVIPLYLLIHMSPATQVNGSSHTALGPYWADVLGKPSLRAVAASKRSGDIAVEVCECIRCCGLRCLITQSVCAESSCSCLRALCSARCCLDAPE